MVQFRYHSAHCKQSFKLWDSEINNYANLVGLFAACLCRADLEYSRYAFVDASRQTTKILDDLGILIYLEPVQKSTYCGRELM